MVYWKDVIKGIAAGMAIAIGAVVYLLCSMQNQVVAGALLFAVGILVVMEFKFHLFTGYVPNKRVGQKKLMYLLNCFLVFIYNLVGASIMALFIRFSRIWTTSFNGVTFEEKINSVMDVKLNDNLLSIFFLSILCGIIIAMIVMAKRYKESVIYAVMLIAVFIICGFEHVVANSFYITITGKLFTGSGMLFMLVNLLGNFVGGFIYSFVRDLDKKEEPENNDSKLVS